MARREDFLPAKGRWTDARAGVLGLGRSGVAAATLLLEEQAFVSLFDDRGADDLSNAARMLRDRVESMHIGGAGLDVASVAELDVLVVSPGVPGDHPLVRAAEDHGVPVISELELAARRLEGPVLLVTGTNGKSTTVSLIHHILGCAGMDSILAGNIGTAVSAVAAESRPHRPIVIEASSFQLERIDTLKPNVAVLLNVAPDHLDRYVDVDAYAAAKRNMLKNMDEADAFVFPRGDARAEAWSAMCSSRLLRFGAAPIAAEEAGAGLDEGWIVRRFEDRLERVLPADELTLLGAHNLLNALASVAALLPLGLDVEAVSEGLRSFRGLPHRMELVGEIDSVRYVNDSKATNVHATATALAGLEGPVLLMLGGSAKGEDFTPLSHAAGPVSVALCYGEEGPRIAEALNGVVTVEEHGGMLTALGRARELAAQGDTVLLSPACASFDEFSGFEARGDAFRDWVERRGGGVS